MEMNSDHLFQIIGVKEAELVMLRIEVTRLTQKYEPKPVPDNVQPIKEAG